MKTTEKIQLEVLFGQENQRLDKFLAEQISAIRPEITRSKIQQFFTQNLIIESGSCNSPSPSSKTKIGQKFLLQFPEISTPKLTASLIPFEIIYEDEHLLVINKPAGLTVHPGSGNQNQTLVNALLFSHADQLSSINGEARPGIVHRLDKDTSGLMLVAKNDLSHLRLSEMLVKREIKRIYRAFIFGVMPNAFGIINKNIARCRQNRLKMAITHNGGRQAITYYQTKEIYLDGFASMVECRLQTGRTHQIRLHFESEKHSLIGDQIYNGCRYFAGKNVPPEIAKLVLNFPRQALHSCQISFQHPITEEEMQFTIDLPNDLKNLQKILKF